LSRRVRFTLDEQGLAAYVANQLNAVFPDGRKVASDTIRAILPAVTERIEHCFVRVNNKYFFDGTQATFDHLHGDQYAMFLYLLANTAYRQGVGGEFATKVFLLNKALHGIDAFFEVELPSIFLFVHPLATVLGRGRYADYLLVYQRCGVGANHDVYPDLGEFTTMRPGSAVLGRSRIGRNCTIAAESLVLDQDLADNTLYIGNPRDFVTRPAEGALPIWRI
jgi:serine O-acetyltransferase